MSIMLTFHMQRCITVLMSNESYLLELILVLPHCFPRDFSSLPATCANYDSSFCIILSLNFHYCWKHRDNTDEKFEKHFLHTAGCKNQMPPVWTHLCPKLLGHVPLKGFSLKDYNPQARFTIYMCHLSNVSNIMTSHHDMS